MRSEKYNTRYKATELWNEVNKDRWARKDKYFSGRHGSLCFSQWNSVTVYLQQAFKMAGFVLGKKHGPRLQKNGGFLIMLVVHLMAGLERNGF